VHQSSYETKRLDQPQTEMDVGSIQAKVFRKVGVQAADKFSFTSSRSHSYLLVKQPYVRRIIYGCDICSLQARPYIPSAIELIFGSRDEP
jgi:hypothetical protein